MKNNLNFYIRFLIGIRYWVEFDGRGKEYWVFETRYDKDIKPNATNGSIFWITQGIFLAIWICAMVYQLISVQLTMVIVE